LTYSAYCTYHGRSSPSVSRIDATSSGDGLRPARRSAGSEDGITTNTRKVMNETTSSSRADQSTRRTT